VTWGRRPPVYMALHRRVICSLGLEACPGYPPEPQARQGCRRLSQRANRLTYSKALGDTHVSMPARKTRPLVVSLGAQLFRSG
jgi:hypothetical protein